MKCFFHRPAPPSTRIALSSRLCYCFFWLFLILPCQVLSEGESEWRNEVIPFTSREGLPTSSIFRVIEDDRGYIWLASNHGAVRYDGYNFHTFTTKDGLTDNTVLSLFKDRQNRIWFVTLNRELCYFQNDHIEHFSLGHTQDSLLKRLPIQSLWEDLDGTLWIANERELFRVRENEVIPMNWYDDPRRNEGNYVLYRSGNRWAGLAYGTSFENRLLYHDSTFLALRLQRPRGAGLTTSGIVHGQGVIAVGNTLIQLDTTGRFSLHKSPGKEIVGLNVDRNGHLWVLTDRGAFRYRSGNVTTSLPEPFLPRRIITGILIDRAGNYWFSDRDNGLFLLPGIAFKILRPNSDPNENSFTSIKTDNGAVWFSDRRGSVYRLDSAYRPHRMVNGWDVHTNYAESLDFLLDGRTSIWTGQQLKSVVPTGKDSYRITRLPAGGVKALLRLHDGTVAAGTPTGFRILRGSELIFNSNTLPFIQRTDALHQDREGRLWLGTATGLYSYDGKNFINHGEQNPLLRNRIVAISQCEDRTIILGTRGSGGLIVRGNSVEQINAADGLASDIIRSVYAENDSTIWLGTNKGLSRLHLRKDRNGKYAILNNTTREGLPSNGINAITKHDGYLWLATDDGICRFHPDSSGINRVPLPIEITSVRVNNRPVRLGKHYALDYDQNNIAIGFVGIGFRTLGEITYRYRLLGYGNDTLWQETTDRSEQYLQLPPGDYTFQVMAVNEHGVWNPVPATVTIHITPHITQTTWFKVAVVLLILTLIGTVVYRLFESQKRRHGINAQIQELRQKLLSANMNPHFIFNALSSIQDYINQHNLYEANRFLAQFSRLIRLNMEISQKSFVPLEEEIERLQLYLSLEKLRFGNRLDYRIHVDERIDTDEILIPTLLIQPYLENAIWHGILPLQREGVVEIEVAQRDASAYQITIRDNGVGLGYQGARSPSSHTSMSMKLNRERLELLARSLNRPFTISVENRLSSSGAIEGVIVMIILPLSLPTDAAIE